MKKLNLFLILNNNNIKNINLFLSNYEYIDFNIKDNNTPLFYAIDLGNLEVVKLLIEHGANIYHRNNNLETVFI